MSAIANSDIARRLTHYLEQPDALEWHNRRIYIWGSLQAARQAAMTLDTFQISFEGFVDNDHKRTGAKIEGLEQKAVFYAQDILSAPASGILFILTNQPYASEITKQILGSRFTYENILNLFRQPDVLSIGTVCNLRCQFCPIHGKNAKSLSLLEHAPVEHMPVETAKAVIDRLSSDGLQLALTAFGEPLLHPHFMEILAYALQKFQITSVFSNATVLNRKMADDLIELFSASTPPKKVYSTSIFPSRALIPLHIMRFRAAGFRTVASETWCMKISITSLTGAMRSASQGCISEPLISLQKTKAIIAI